MAKIQNTDNIKHWRECDPLQALIAVEMQNVTATLHSLKFLTNLTIGLPFNPAIALLGIYPNELKT